MDKIQVVLASPSDLNKERQMIRELVDSLNPLYMKNEICIDLRMWENVPPGMNADGPQGVIDVDLEISKADIFICLYWKRIGTILPNENVAGTEHELNLALDSYHKFRKPDIKAFFKTINDKDRNSDAEAISLIAKKLQPLGLYTPFESAEQLKEIINKIIQSEVMKRIRNQAEIIPEIHKYIEVSTVSEFIDGLCSNNKLVLNKGFYDILEFSSDNKNVKKEEVFDGNELVLSNLSNITIVGDNSTLLVSPRYANVMNFCGCSNIKLIGLTIGHTPHKGSCTGAVLRFSDCNNIQMDSLELFGCGTYGIELENCSNVRVNGTRIYECTYGALNILHSSLEFTNSMIYDCNKTAGCLIEASESQIDFNNVTIFDNHIDNYLISLDMSSLFCRAVCVHSNTYAGLCNEELGHGVYLDNNQISEYNGYYITISSNSKTERETYEAIKRIISSCGKIEEMIFEDGNMTIVANLESYDSYMKVNSLIESYGNIDIICG